MSQNVVPHTQSGGEPRLAFRHVEEEKWYEVKAQMHGDRRVSVWEKYLEWSPERVCLYAKYDPGMIIERHGHMSDHIVFADPFIRHRNLPTSGWFNPVGEPDVVCWLGNPQSWRR